MRLIGAIVGCLLAAAAIPAVTLAEDLQGQLVLVRPLTKQRVVLPTYDVRGVAPHKQAATTHAINEWERVVVYLEGNAPPKATPITVTLNQKGQRFEPEMVVIPVGSSVAFPNSDPVFHNVFSLSKVRQFDLGVYPAGDSRTVKFANAGVVQVYCHLHPDMNAAIFVVPNGWYVQPDDHGTFTFSHLPPGDYQIVVWHKSAGFFRKRIQVSPGIPTKVSMEIPLGANP